MFSNVDFRSSALGQFRIALVCALFTSVACGNGDDDSTGAGASGGTSGSGHAGTGGSAGASASAGKGGSSANTGGGSNGGSAGGAGKGGSNAAGTGNRAGTGNAAGTGNTSGEAGGGGDGASGGSGGGGLDDACISPCLKALFTGCRAVDSCTVQTMDSGRTFVECEASSGYRREGDLDPEVGDPTLTVTMDGELCYTATRSDGTWTYYDADQTLVGTATSSASGGTGRCPQLEEPGSEPVYYPIDLTDPRCAPVMCTEGTCP